MNARSKRAAIEEKLARVAELRHDAEGRLVRIEVEDDSLAEGRRRSSRHRRRAGGLPQRRGAHQSSTASRSAARRLRATADRVKADLAKIGDVEAQIALTLEEIAKAEDVAVESFKKEEAR